MRVMFGDEAVKAFCRCNSFKYRFRAARKNGDEDIAKAEWYEEYLFNMEKGDKSRNATPKAKSTSKCLTPFSPLLARSS